jgi:hypothetical protein
MTGILLAYGTGRCSVLAASVRVNVKSSINRLTTDEASLPIGQYEPFSFNRLMAARAVLFSVEHHEGCELLHSPVIGVGGRGHTSWHIYRNFRACMKREPRRNVRYVLGLTAGTIKRNDILYPYFMFLRGLKNQLIVRHRQDRLRISP